MTKDNNAINIDLRYFPDYLNKIGKKGIEPGDYAEIVFGKLYMRNLKADVFVEKTPLSVGGKNIPTVILPEDALRHILRKTPENRFISKISITLAESVDELEGSPIEAVRLVDGKIKQCDFYAKAPRDIVLDPDQIYCCKDSEEGEVISKSECIACLEDRIKNNETILPK